MVNPNVSRRDFMKAATVATGATLLAACAPKAVQTAVAGLTPESLTTVKPPEFPIPLEVISTTEPIPGHPSVVDGLNIGEVTPNNVVGMIPGYESTGINTLYNPNDSSMLITKQNGEQVEAIPPKAFAIDQEQLINYFGAVDTEGVKVGLYNGTPVTLKNGIWTAATRETFIPFIKAEPNTDAVYLVMDANGRIQKVDITGKAVGSPMPMFEQPIEIAKQMGFERADQVVDVEMNKNGSLSFITKEPRPTEDKPDRTVQIVNEVAFLGEPEDLSKTAAAEAAAVAFSGALIGAGLNIAAEDIKKNFTVMRVEGLDPSDPEKQKKKNYDIATVAIEDEKVGGDYPLMIKNEVGEWERSTMGSIAKLLNIPLGTNLSSPSRPNDFGKAAAMKMDKLVTSEYNAAIIEATGWTWTEYKYNQFDWTRSDDSVALARQNKMKIQGDSLVYGWSNKNNTYLQGDFDYKGEQINIRNLHQTDPEKAKKILTDIMVNHIITVMKRYKGRIDQWKVVNEIGVKQGDDIFLDVIGPEYVKIAYTTARAADPGALLILNDANCNVPNGEKCSKVKAIVDDLKKDGLIDAIGIQMHINAATPPSKKDLVEGFQSWGLPVIITEADINLNNTGGTSEQRFKKQAELGLMIFQAYIEAGVGAGFFMWDGLGDNFSWLENPKNENQPNADGTPFDGQGNPKLWVSLLLKEMTAALLEA